MSVLKISIEDKEYEPRQQTLIDIWHSHLKNVQDGLNLGFLTFVNKRPKNPKSNNRRIAGLKAESISYLKDDRELVKMSDENFIYLMAKMGIGITIEEVGG